MLVAIGISDLNASELQIRTNNKYKLQLYPSPTGCSIKLTKMETQTQANETSAVKALFVKMAVSSWETQISRVNDLLEKLSDEELNQETAPGRNTGTYLLGHLIAVNDRLLPLFGFEESRYPELENIFLTLPDKSGILKPSVHELRIYWREVNAKLAAHFNKMQPEDWFTKHTAVSPEDFAKEPHRNKLNVLMNRTSHHSYHLGQLTFLVKKQDG
jgi:uncharacterized damage-inducible protein DinB